jgi:hypothetical protein
MATLLAQQLCDRLDEAAVIVEPERRGRDPLPGRPDSVLWLRPSGLAVQRLVPLLVELEGTGNYHAAKKDVQAFAQRHDPDKRSERDQFQYHLNFPTLDRTWAKTVDDDFRFTEAAAPMAPKVEYEMFALPSSTVTGERTSCDGALHQAIQKPFQKPRQRQETPTGFDSGARIKTIGRTEIVFWTVEWQLPGGNSGTLSVPFIVKAGSHLEAVLCEDLDPVSLPTAAVIDGAPGARSDTLQHETGVRFPYLSPANVTQPVEGVRKAL